MVVVIQQFLVNNHQLRRRSRKFTSKSWNKSGVYGSFGNSVTLVTTYFMQFQLQENALENNFGPEDRTITFTNSGVSNTDLQISIMVVNR